MGAHLSKELYNAEEEFSWNWVSQGFVNGVSLYAALPVITAILRRSRVDSAAWRTAVSAGCFLGGYRLLIQLLKKKFNLPAAIPERAKQFLAAGGATAIALAVDDHFLGSFLVIWWCLRAVRCMLPNSELAPVALMSASASVLAPAAFLFRDEHQKQYQSFMENMAFRMERRSLLQQDVPIVGKSVHGWDRWVFCDELNVRFPGSHETGSCTRAVASTVVPRIFLMSLRMYGPLYLAWSFFKMRLPNSRTLENVARSSIFLTGYTVTQYLGIMWWQASVSPTVSRLQHASFAWLSGLWTLLERKERRPELATYCTAHALNSLYNLAKKKGIVARTPRIISYLLLMAASGTLAAFNDQHPEFVKKCFGFGDVRQEKSRDLPV